MWISREDFEGLLERIRNLERQQVVRYGRQMYFTGPSSDHKWCDHDTSCTGDVTSVNELVARIAQYLGR